MYTEYDVVASMALLEMTDEEYKDLAITKEEEIAYINRRPIGYKKDGMTRRYEYIITNSPSEEVEGADVVVPMHLVSRVGEKTIRPTSSLFYLSVDHDYRVLEAVCLNNKISLPKFVSMKGARTKYESYVKVKDKKYN